MEDSIPSAIHAISIIWLRNQEVTVDLTVCLDGVILLIVSTVHGAISVVFPAIIMVIIVVPVGPVDGMRVL